MKPLRSTHALVKRLVPAVAVWAIGKALDSAPVRSRLKRVDDRVYAKRKAAVRNARHNKRWLAAGALAFVAGVGMMAKAAKR